MPNVRNVLHLHPTAPPVDDAARPMPRDRSAALLSPVVPPARTVARPSESSITIGGGSGPVSRVHAVIFDGSRVSTIDLTACVALREAIEAVCGRGHVVAMCGHAYIKERSRAQVQAGAADALTFVVFSASMAADAVDAAVDALRAHAGCAGTVSAVLGMLLFLLCSNEGTATFIVSARAPAGEWPKVCVGARRVVLYLYLYLYFVQVFGGRVG
jgi:hypothetical protein